MISATDLPDVIPVFPLPGALMLPRARLPLHIFEPRYLAMIEDCLKTKHRLIGMIQPRETPAAGNRPAEKRLQAIGCAGRLTGFSETEDGRYMITLSGASRFRVKEEVQGFTPYRRCLVDWTPFARDLGPTEDDKSFRRGEFMVLLGRYFSHMKLSTDWDSLKDAEAELLINSLSMLCPFSPEDLSLIHI
jgi:Lon protease-like protein